MQSQIFTDNKPLKIVLSQHFMRILILFYLS